MTLTCTQCNSPLGGGVLAGLCPRCLGLMALGQPTRPSVGDYELVREIGRGGMGVVYEAFQRGLNRRVAIKMLSGVGFGEGRERLKARFQREAEAAARLAHPGIVTVHEVGEFDGQPFFAMELIEGASLAARLGEGLPPPLEAARLVRRVAEAVAHAHSRGVLHRDLKPSNVLLEPSGRVCVTDFGLAKQFDSDQQITRSGELLGSPGYVAPELLEGRDASQASDVHGLGGLLYHLLTGRPPFAGPTVAATLEQVRTRDPDPISASVPGIPRDLETVCLKCLRREPDARYATAAEVAADLLRFERGEPVAARSVSSAQRLGMWCRRRPAVAVLLLALLMTLIAGGVGVFVQWRRAEESRTVLERNLYAADVAAASSALREGNLGRARALLESHRSGASADHTRASGAARAGTDLREFAWRLLWARSRSQEIDTLGTHAWIVTDVAISPDKAWGASGGMASTDTSGTVLRLWSLGNGKGSLREPRGDRVLGATGTVWSVTFTADSRTLISAGADGVKFWDVETGRSAAGPANGVPFAQEIDLRAGQLVGSPNIPFLDPEEPKPLWHCDLATATVRMLPARGWHPTLSPEGRRLAFVDEHRSLKLIDLRSGAEILTVATNQSVFRLRFSPDGRALLAVGPGVRAHLWELPEDPRTPTGVRAPVVFRHEHNAWDGQFTPDGREVILGTSDQRLQRWTRDGSSLVETWLGHENEVWAVAVSPDGSFLLSGGKDRTVRRWAGRATNHAPSVAHWRYVAPLFSADGRHLATYHQSAAGEGSVLWDLSGVSSARPPAEVARSPGFPRGLSSDARHLLYWDQERRAVEWMPTRSGDSPRAVMLSNAPAGLLPNELRMSGDARRVICPDATGTFRRWSTETGRQDAEWSDEQVSRWIRDGVAGVGNPDRIFRALQTSPSGRWLALASPVDPTVILVDLDHGTTHRLRGHDDDVVSLCFGVGERLLATGSVDASIRLWGVSEGTLEGVLRGHLESVEALSFSPDGKTLASGNPGIEVRFWHVPTLRELATLPMPGMGQHLTFSPDGTLLAVGWVTRAGEPRVELWSAPAIP